MKKLITLLTVCILLFASVSSAFASSPSNVSIEYLENGDYIVTVIEDADVASITMIAPKSMKTETKTKTVTYNNASGQAMWYVRVTGTFTYGDGSAICISATPSAASQNSAWKVSDISGSKSGNRASASATGKKYMDGVVVDIIRETVTLTCSPTGVFS